MNRSLIVFLVLFSQLIFAQGDGSTKSDYPLDYFINPLEITPILSGTFAELRSNHFHAGLDIKTNQVEGLNVLASASGYVSRIKISHWGYGKALYITHPNGYTSVYAHLKKFSPKIEAYIKKKQYEKESFEIQVFPKRDELTVSQTEIVALSGATGGFVGPHLHFEIRDTKTEKPINPMYFGITVEDHKKPRINTALAYPLSEKAQINGVQSKTKLNLTKLEDGTLKSTPIKAFGSIGFGINTYDQLDNAYNKNGLYSLEMKVNGERKHLFKASSFAFDETKYINLLIDYERYNELSQRIQKCFIEPANIFSSYDRNLGNGYINIEEGKEYTVEIIAKDYKGNVQKLIIPVLGDEKANPVIPPSQKTHYYIAADQFHKYSQNGVTIAFPKNTFYRNAYLDFSVENGIAKVHKPNIPLSRNYTLTFDVSDYSEANRENMYIAKVDDKGKTSYVSTKKKDNSFYTTTKSLGNYTLDSDSEAPEINLKSFKQDQWISAHKTLQVKISDKKSGIKSYRGEINGEWILMEYNVKNGELTYDFSDKSFPSGKHDLKVVVTDNAGNEKTLNATFFRKN